MFSAAAPYPARPLFSSYYTAAGVLLPLLLPASFPSSLHAFFFLHLFSTSSPLSDSRRIRLLFTPGRLRLLPPPLQSGPPVQFACQSEMAFRGGRGRGRGGFHRGGFHRGTEEPFKLYPEDVALPDKKCVPIDEEVFRWNNKLQSYFENSAYYVEELASGDAQNCDIERYSDLLKPRNKMKRESLSDYMKLQPGYFPLELIQGMKARPQKKVKWDIDQGSKSLDDLFNKLVKKDKEKKAENQGKDEDGDEEDDDEEKEEDYSSGGDYEQNKDFDDDDDDFNDNDDGDDEPFY